MKQQNALADTDCLATNILVHEASVSALLFKDDYKKQAHFYKQAVRRKNKLLSFLSPDEVKEAMNNHLEELPQHLMIIGSGYLGVELASMYAAFGSKVTLLESGSEFLPQEDRDMAHCVQEVLEKRGVEIRLLVSPLAIKERPCGSTLVDTTNATQSNSVTCPTVYSAFINPPLVRIGLTEEEATKAGRSIKVFRLPAHATPRARVLQQTDGLLKAIVDAPSGEILGCTLFCAEASEVINIVSIAMQTKQPYSFLRDFSFTHLSMSKAMNELFKE